MFLYISHMKSFIAAALLSATSLIAPAPSAQAATYCDNYNGWYACSDLGGSIDTIAITNDGYEAVIQVTCTSDRWILHSGSRGNIPNTAIRAFAKGYCEGRGSHFSN